MQQLDRACTAIAVTSIALQLLGAVWRLLGQLVVVEVLTFVMLRPKVLQRLHQLLATRAVSFSTAMHKLGLNSSALNEGGLQGRCCSSMLCWRLSWVCPRRLATPGSMPWTRHGRP